MANSTATQLKFPPIPGFTVRGQFDGGAISSDFGPMILRGIDRHTGLISRLSDAIFDQRHPSYIDHSIQSLLSQRVFQLACGYEDGNDSNLLRHDPIFKLGLEKRPLVEEDALASAPTFSRFENCVSKKDLYRIAQAFVEQFIASYREVPSVIILDMDHSEDRTHGQQELALFNGYYGHHCLLPLFIFEGLSGKFISGVLRPGCRPTGKENAMIMKRILTKLRTSWPKTHIILRGDCHFANKELMALCADDLTHFVFGLPTNAVLNREARPLIEATSKQHEIRSHNAKVNKQLTPNSTKSYHEIEYRSKSWDAPYRTILKSEITSLGENPRFVVTSLSDPDPKCVYQDLYCPRGQDENFIKMIKNDLASDRTSDHKFTANQMRLFYSCAAYVLHHSLRSEFLKNTPLEKSQPATVILKIFKISVRVKQYKDRIHLQLPSSCVVKEIIEQVSEWLFNPSFMDLHPT